MRIPGLTVPILIFISIYISIFFVFNSCAPDKPYVPTVFEGEWEDVSPETFLGGIRCQYWFRSDSFFTKTLYYSDVQSAPCYPDFHCFVYTKGTFTYNRDTIYFHVFKTDSEFIKLNYTKYPPQLEFESTRKYKFRNDTLLIYDNKYFVDDGCFTEDFVNKFEYRFVTYFKRKN